MENREQPKPEVFASCITVLQKENDKIKLDGKPDIKSPVGDLPDNGSIEIMVNDMGEIEFSQLSPENQEGLDNNLNRRMTQRAMQVKQQLKSQSNRNNIEDEMSK